MSDPGDSGREQLDALRQQIDLARATLDALHADISDAQARLDGTESVQLLQANEQLVLAMLQAQGEADTVAAALQAASRSAEHDGLTRLPNRSLLHDRWAQAAANARRHGMKMALLFVDLNDFKAINDELGHLMGDEVLVAVADRLTRSVREADTVGRYGGDEFVVLLAEIASPADAAVIARKLLEAMAEPLRVRDHALLVTASIGISIYPDDGDSETALLEMADEAMYGAKAQGGSAFRFHAAPAADAVQFPPRSGHKLWHALGKQEHLNQMLREANERLVIASLGAAELQDTAEGALARHQTYLALLGHEIRTPLSPLRNVAALLDRAPLQQAALTRLKLTIERQVVQIARLVDDMLAFASASKPRLEVEFQPADVVALAHQAAEACQASVDARRQTLQLLGTHATEAARVDPVRLVQIITNLIDNASKYTPAEGRIVVRVDGTPTEVSIAVADNGMGLSSSDSEALFEPFSRAPEALASGSPGLGIGLTVVRELVRAHQGSITVASGGIGLGAEFVVRLPR